MATQPVAASLLLQALEEVAAPIFASVAQKRIRGHVQQCWLALLLIRVAENTTGDTWRTTRHELDRMHLVTLATPAGTLAQRTATTAGQKSIRVLNGTLPDDGAVVGRRWPR